MPERTGPEQGPSAAAWQQVRRDVLLRVALRILGDEHEAEDVVQETLARVWERIEEFRPNHLGGYLARAVEMNALKRRARRRRLVSLDGLKELPANPDEPESDELDPSVLEDALLGLPPTQQVVIRMKYYLGLSFREIGEALAISQNTAASRCRYGLETLRNALRRRT